VGASAAVDNYLTQGIRSVPANTVYAGRIYAVTTTQITVTDKAQQELIGLEVNHEQFLRLWVEPGGCSGMSYGAAIDEEMGEGDQIIFENEQIRVVADPESVRYFDGLTIDYTDDLVQSGFRFINPNAVQSCGCGSSFSCDSCG